MADVVSLTGEVVSAGVPDEDTVRVLEDMLSRARSGDVTGVVGVACFSDETVSHFLVGTCVSYRVLGGLEVCRSIIVERVRDE